jgi:hypothetical protein
MAKEQYLLHSFIDEDSIGGMVIQLEIYQRIAKEQQ